MSWREALLYKAKRRMETAEHNLRSREYELNNRFYRYDKVLPDNEIIYYDHLKEDFEQKSNEFRKLGYEVNKMDGPNNFFGYRDEWMLAWDYKSNWIECFLRNTNPHETIYLLVWLGICPTKIVTDHWDKQFRIDKEKILRTDHLVNVEINGVYTMQSQKYTPDEWFDIVMYQHSQRVQDWINNTY